MFADGLPAVERDCEGQQDDEEAEGFCRGQQGKRRNPGGAEQTLGEILRPVQKGGRQSQEHAVATL